MGDRPPGKRNWTSEKPLERTRLRAEAIFNIYYGLGVNRSFAALLEYLGKIGVRLSQNTIERWSSQFHWQEEVVKRDTLFSEDQKRQAATSIETMNTRQSQVGRSLQSIGVQGLKPYLDALRTSTPLPLAPATAVELIKSGVQIERLAMGEVTDRNEAVIRVHNSWVLHISEIFLSVNNVVNPDERAEQFASKVDAFIQEQLPAGEKLTGHSG